MHPRSELVAERRIGELNVIGIDHQLRDGVLHRRVLEQAQLDAERARRLAHQRLHARRHRRVSIGPADGAARRDGVQHLVVLGAARRLRGKRDAGDDVGRLRNGGSGVSAPVRPKARSAANMVSAAAAHDMVISRSCGSTMCKARLVSATMSTWSSLSTKRHG
ncbi:MAG: hypothetical protein M5U07_11250 [Xanthobacteraceae bacterium]|nr:hypothetical protein [Xanthobacteraceae bacterium]